MIRVASQIIAEMMDLLVNGAVKTGKLLEIKTKLGLYLSKSTRINLGSLSVKN